MKRLDDSFEDLLREGNQAWSTGRKDLAVRYYQMLIERFPDNPNGYNRLGAVTAESGDLAQAKWYFARALECDGRHAPTLSNLGNISLEEGDLDEAIAFYGLALGSDPDYAPAHHNLAVAYRQKGQLGTSVRHLKLAQRLERRRDALDAAHRGDTRRRYLRMGGRFVWWWIPALLLIMGILGRAIR